MKAWLGGTFDPVHLGHINLAERLLERLDLENLFLMPCHLAVHKKSVSASPKQRLEMLKIALDSRLGLFIDDRELIADKPSFTYDSLVKIRAENADESISFIMGMDSLIGFSDWKNASLFSGLTNLIILERPGETFGMLEASYLSHKRAALNDLADFGFLQVENKSGLQNSRSGKFAILDVGLFNISSSKIRSLVKEGHSIAHLVGDKVADYIKLHHLYS